MGSFGEVTEYGHGFKSHFLFDLKYTNLNHGTYLQAASLFLGPLACPKPDLPSKATPSPSAKICTMTLSRVQDQITGSLIRWERGRLEVFHY